jgi:hypothetical protein
MEKRWWLLPSVYRETKLEDRGKMRNDSQKNQGKLEGWPKYNGRQQAAIRKTMRAFPSFG